MKIASDTDLTAAIAQPSIPSQAAPTPGGSVGAVLRGTMSDAGAQAAPKELSGIGVMERAVDADGAYVADLFQMRYADGTYSGAGDVFEIDAMRRQALASEAPGVSTDPAYEAAHTKFNLDQIAYDAAITRADPTIAARRLTVAATYAPDGEAAPSAADA